MSAAAVADAASAPPKKGKKKLIVIVTAVVLLLVLGGGGAMFMMKKRSAEAAEGEDGEQAVAHAAVKHDPKAPPTFMPLDAFTVNLADRESERYAQIGVTLEVIDSQTIEDLKAYMPAIRNNILMVLAHKTSAELLERTGKETLADEIRRETLRPLGIEVDDEDEDEGGEEAKAKKKKKKKRAPQILPVTQVHFSNFIIQ